ncbi:hypothetical protein KTO58_07665 [Chitinophaga pendula]|uniref:hypothetical protein n=1 Tax=Chitinophaga TaxID=79328 RepID=UPI0012FDB2F3|nr:MULTISPECIES: hypothetical protein [Chitinophaga]UCJ09047.1 hypothetical protein KTO58_07665 [Chitinophaga pendula]
MKKIPHFQPLTRTALKDVKGGGQNVAAAGCPLFIRCDNAFNPNNYCASFAMTIQCYCVGVPIMSPRYCGLWVG